MNSIPASTSRVLGALGLTLILFGAVGVTALYAMSERSLAEAELSARETELEILKRRPAGQQAQAGVRFTADPFLQGATVALAANGLQQRIAALVDETGGRLISIGVEPPSDAPEARGRVLVQATAAMDVNGLQTLLFRLESEAPFLFVDSLNVLRAGNEGAEPDPHALQMLNVDLRVAGYVREGAPS